jgi:hypothetical protein
LTWRVVLLNIRIFRKLLFFPHKILVIQKGGCSNMWWKYNRLVSTFTGTNGFIINTIFYGCMRKTCLPDFFNRMTFTANPLTINFFTYHYSLKIKKWSCMRIPTNSTYNTSSVYLPVIFIHLSSPLTFP